MGEWAFGIIAVLFTGILGYWLGIRGFIIQERFRDRQRKLEGLREFLGGPAEEMLAVLNSPIDRVMTTDDHDRLVSHIRDLHAQADKLKPLFVESDEMQAALNFMGNVLSTVLMRRRTLLNRMLPEGIERFIHHRSIVEAHLVFLEKELYQTQWRSFWK